MLFRVLADAVVVCHFLFIVFVVLGGFLTFRWPRLVWVHIPSFLWGAAISFFGWRCPLTHLEIDLRVRGAAEGYGTSFIEEYILPLVYPAQLFGSFPRSGFILLGVIVLMINAVLYWRLYKKRLAK